MHLMLNSLDDPISTGETFPERKPAVSPSLSGITNQFISLTVSFMQMHSISWPSNHLAASAKCPCSPRSGEPAVLPAQDTPLHRLSWGGVFSRERPRKVGSHAQGIFTKANRLVFPSPEVSVWKKLLWYHHAAKTKEHLQNMCTSLPVPPGLRVSGAFTETLCLPCHQSATSWNPHCNCQHRGCYSSHTAAMEEWISWVNSCFRPFLQA